MDVFEIIFSELNTIRFYFVYNKYKKIEFKDKRGNDYYKDIYVNDKTYNSYIHEICQKFYKVLPFIEQRKVQEYSKKIEKLQNHCKKGYKLLNDYTPKGLSFNISSNYVYPDFTLKKFLSDIIKIFNMPEIINSQLYIKDHKKFENNHEILVSFYNFLNHTNQVINILNEKIKLFLLDKDLSQKKVIVSDLVSKIDKTVNEVQSVFKKVVNCGHIINTYNTGRIISLIKGTLINVKNEEFKKLIANYIVVFDIFKEKCYLDYSDIYVYEPLEKILNLSKEDIKEMEEKAEKNRIVEKDRFERDREISTKVIAWLNKELKKNESGKPDKQSELESFNSNLESEHIKMIKIWIDPDLLDCFNKIEKELLSRDFLTENYKWDKSKRKLIELFQIYKENDFFKKIVLGNLKQEFHYRQFVSLLYGFEKKGLTETSSKYKPTIKKSLATFYFINIP